MKLSFSLSSNRKLSTRSKSAQSLRIKHIIMIFDVGGIFGIKLCVPTLCEEHFDEVYKDFHQATMKTLNSYDIFNITVRKYYKIVETLYGFVASAYCYTIDSNDLSNIQFSKRVNHETLLDDYNFLIGQNGDDQI